MIASAPYRMANAVTPHSMTNLENDEAADRRIIERLKVDALDGEGGFLIPALERLHELLEKPERAAMEQSDDQR